LCEVQLEEALQEDWNAEWKKHYSPIKVNSQIEVLPSWHQKEISSIAKQISIYPGMGFGTGSHETTFLCLKLFTENCNFSDLGNVLDFGSGSGILGLSSMLFNENHRVDFYDIDPEANKNCYQNAELNHLSERSFRLLLPEYRQLILPKYDLIFANILENILISESAYLIDRMNTGSCLILSGLLNHQVQGIIDLYSSKGLKLMKDVRKGDWGALLLKKE
jgi:ribosomal protein L11 methyltransferase